MLADSAIMQKEGREEGGMESKVTADDSSLMERAFQVASEEAQTLESFSESLGMSAEDASMYWFVVNRLRRSQGHHLPAPLDAMSTDGECGLQPPFSSWYFPTWRLNKLLEEFQVNEGLAVHYEQILYDPEGGHFELNLAACEVVLAVCLDDPSLDAKRMRRVCVHACEPGNGIELLVSNAGKVLLSVENYRDEPITAAFIENLYAKLIWGISVKEVRGAEEYESHAVKGLRRQALEDFCRQMQPEGHAGGNHTLINALTALHFFRTFRLFPAGNNVLAYLMYFLILHRAGYHFSAHVPVVKLLYADSTAADCAEDCSSTDSVSPAGASASTDGVATADGSARSRRLSCDPRDLAVECDGCLDWTRFFERAVELVVNEQRWTMTKLEGMSRRRERFRVIIDSDESMNFRQKEVLLEAVLHSNAEFTYAIHEQRYDVSYPCARSDFARLLDMGFLSQHDDGIRHFFFASDDFSETFLDYLKKHCPQTFYRYYDEDGCLRDEYKSAEEVAFEYNKDIGFYEKSLLDKTYIEHYDFRRTPIADHDGPRRRSQPEG